MLFFRTPTTKEEAVEQIQTAVQHLEQTECDWAPFDTSRLDRRKTAFYDEARKNLESAGFTYLADMEDRVITRRGGPRTFLRFMLAPDYTIMSAIYHIVPSWPMKLAGAKECKVVEFETLLSNGSFLCTGNSEMATKLDSPAQIDSRDLPAGTSWTLVLEAHRNRLQAALAGDRGAFAVPVKNLSELLRAQNEQRRIRGEFRKRVGLSKVELERLGGVRNSSAAAELHSAVLQKN
jgi:hypothetical protein